MELLTHKDRFHEYTCYLGKDGKRVLHGECKAWHHNGTLWKHSFRYHGKTHGEYKRRNLDGKVCDHCFFINGKRHPYVEMNEHEKLLFQIKHPGFRFLPTS